MAELGFLVPLARYLWCWWSGGVVVGHGEPAGISCVATIFSLQGP